jgi:hypothetical protein
MLLRRQATLSNTQHRNDNTPKNSGDGDDACGLLRSVQQRAATTNCVGAAFAPMGNKPAINTEWFHQQFERQESSLRSFARHAGMDPAVVSRMLSGQRRMKLEEAQEIANFLRVPLVEVLKHAGLSIDDDGSPTRILLAATVNETGQIQRLPEPRPLPQSVIERAQSAIDTLPMVIAAQVRALSGPLTIFDDAVILFGHTDAVDPAAIGVLSVCRSFAGEQIIAKIERARKTGEARVITVDGKTKEFDLHTATPVIAIIP